jgi:hypothetical protein
MNTTKKSEPLVEECYYENQRNFPESELAKYYGKHVAWSRDGTAILASGATWEELFADMGAKHLDPFKDVVVGYVDVPGEVHLGWF